MALPSCAFCAGDRTALHAESCEVRQGIEMEPERFTIYVSDSDDDENAGLLVIDQRHGSRFATEVLQSTMGSRWESGGTDFAYCAITVDDWDTLLATIEEETGCKVEDRIGQ